MFKGRLTSRTLKFALLVALLALLASAGAASAKLHRGDVATIKWTDDGLVSAVGPVNHLSTGNFGKSFHQLTLKRARRLLGKPNRVTPNRYRSSCVVKWKALRLRFVFATLGLQKRKCPYGLSDVTILSGAKVIWQTQNGLKIGDSVDTMDGLFPDNYQADEAPYNERVLVDHVYPWGGAEGSASPTVVAILDADLTRVVGFRLWVGQQGE